MESDFNVHSSTNEHIRCIDVHHHYFPSDLNKNQSNSEVGWKTPTESLPWSPEVSLRAMDEMKVDVAILSFPAISSGSVSEKNRAMARERNEMAAQVCRAHPSRFNFFATLPFLDDIEGTLHEMNYAFDTLNAKGVSLSSSYGQGASASYIGDEKYSPVWAELDRRETVVFLHGSQVPSSTPYPNQFLGIPITEVPNETFKAASHLVVSRQKRRFPNVKIILAHMGGSLLSLVSRVAVLSSYMGCILTPEEILADFKTFYYETALSSYEPNLVALEKFVPQDHILFGTDLPAVNIETAEWFTKNLEKHFVKDRETLAGVMGKNAARCLRIQLK